MNKVKIHMNRNGYIAISMTLILLVVTIGITTTLSFLSAGSAKISESLRQGEQALFYSEGCLEEGLLKLKTDPLYAGGEVSFPGGTCHIDVGTDGGAYTFRIFFSDNNSSYQRSIEAKAEIADGFVHLLNWKEKKIVVE